MRLKQGTIAKEIGVTEGRVSQLKKQGMPVNSMDAARAWYSANVDQTFSPKLVPGIVLPPVSGGGMPELLAETFDLQRARAKRETHEANLAELRERQALGELVEADRVKRAVSSLAAMVRSAFERIPDKLADRLAAQADAQQCHVLLTTEIDLVLADLSAGASNLQLVAEDGRA
jgi:phage terminase Nu1 subunit (DNA packaging protein)